MFHYLLKTYTGITGYRIPEKLTNNWATTILTIPQYILVFMTLYKSCLNGWSWRVGSGWWGVGTYRYNHTDPFVWHAHHETWSGIPLCILRTNCLGGLPRQSALDALAPLTLRHNWLYRPSVEKEHRCFPGTGF